ncbi:hypothetical protein Q6346_11200 [Isoptericola sp. b490]|uniref:hypothetical protein n=1 Tax=Actinotalea lenta TaxID=3064654 RepID=UPI0027125A3F|nr:hypothetical protein [Isoptericola sp. b490]MDO8121878.1 hypothetical protein [Isoptericola sp. b490]
MTAAAVPLLASHWWPFGPSGHEVVVRAATPGLTGDETPDRMHDDLLRGSWSGAAAWPLSPAHGDVTVDAWVGRLSDDDPMADYYVVHLATAWVHQGGLARLPAPVTLTVVSDVDALDGVHGATRSFVSGASCDDLVTLPATTAAHGREAVASVCHGYGVRLLGQDARSASWQVVRPAGLRQVELVFLQEVPHGARPTWAVTIATPAGLTARRPWDAGSVTWSTVTATLAPTT